MPRCANTPAKASTAPTTFSKLFPSSSAWADTIDAAAAIVFAYFYGAIAAAQSIQAGLDQSKLAMEQISLGDATLPTIRTPGRRRSQHSRARHPA